MFIEIEPPAPSPYGEDNEATEIQHLFVADDVDDNSEKPEPSIASYFTRVDEGQSTSLLCAFQGVPYPTYSWQFANDTQVDDSDERFLYQYDRQVINLSILMKISGQSFGADSREHAFS